MFQEVSGVQGVLTIIKPSPEHSWFVMSWCRSYLSGCEADLL